MAIRKILVPLSGLYAPGTPSNLDEAALRAAIKSAHRFKAHVEAFCIDAEEIPAAHRLPAWLPGAVVEDLLLKIDEEEERRNERAWESFEAVTKALGVAPTSEAAAGAGFSLSFEEEAGELPKVLAFRGRLADLIVIGNAPADDHAAPAAVLEVALRETGRPVLVVPCEDREFYDRHIVIAWNGSKEASRAVALADDFLARADKVTILSVEEDGIAHPGPKELVRFLRLHGVEAEARAFAAARDATGSALLDEAATIGADLLVMGAYTRSRVRQLILGDVTGSVLADPRIPAFMVE